MSRVTKCLKETVKILGGECTPQDNTTSEILRKMASACGCEVSDNDNTVCELLAKVNEKLPSKVVHEVDELPKLSWSGTAVPNTGNVERIHFNFNLSVEEVISIIENADLPYHKLNSISDSLVYVVFFSSEDAFIQIYKDFTKPGQYAILVENNGSYYNFFSDEGWDNSRNSGEFYNTEAHNYTDFTSWENGEVGTKNQLLSQLISITPFEQTPKVRSVIALTGQPTTVPNSGSVEKLFFNTNLSLDEYHNILSNITFIDGSVMGLSGFLFYPVMGYLVDSVPYILFLNKRSDNDISLLLINASEMSELQRFCDAGGWHKFTNPYTIGYEIFSEFSGLPIGNQNEMLKDIISTTPFETLHLVENGQFVELVRKE